MGEALVKLYFLAVIYSLMVIVVAVYTLAWVLGPAIKHVARKLAEGWYQGADARPVQRFSSISLSPRGLEGVKKPATSPASPEVKPDGSGEKTADAGHRWLR